MESITFDLLGNYDLKRERRKKSRRTSTHLQKQMVTELQKALEFLFLAQFSVKHVIRLVRELLAKNRKALKSLYVGSP